MKDCYVNDANAIEYGLVHNAWQLRATARDLLLEQDLERATSLLLEAVETGDIFEAQAAVTTLATVPSLFAKIDAFTLRRELKLEYAQGDSLEVENDWIVWGGKPNLGKQVVYNNPLGQCMRCHKIDDHGGIAGPSLDGIADRMTQEQLLESLINPNANVADGFGEYSAMPLMGTMLNHRELRDVVAFLKTLLSDQE